MPEEGKVVKKNDRKWDEVYVLSVSAGNGLGLGDDLPLKLKGFVKFYLFY